jgi:dephospho-CoA kinase
MVKIGICGKMASGKTTLANEIMELIPDMNKHSLAKAVKDFATFVYDIEPGHKDRVAFQKIGDGARKHLYENIWIETLIKKINLESQINYTPSGEVDMNGRDYGLDWENPDASNYNYHCIVDDIRYVNEVRELKKAGWIIIKLDIAEDLQLERLKKTYPNDWETHYGARQHPSELEIDLITEGMVDLVIQSKDDDSVVKSLNEFLNPTCEIWS